MEKVHAPQGRQCDGGQLEYDSLCCHNDEHNSGCNNSPCQNYVPGKLDSKLAFPDFWAELRFLIKISIFDLNFHF